MSGFYRPMDRDFLRVRMVGRSLLKSLSRRMLNWPKSWNADEDQKALVPDPRIIFDVGANIGQTARRYRIIFPGAQIYSFEPVPKAFDRLCGTSAGDSRICPINVALCDKIGTLPMYAQGDSPVNSLLPFSEREETRATIQVPATTVDAFCSERKIAGIDILKVDAEGAELSIFRGAAGMFAHRAIRCIFTEVYFDPVFSGMPLLWDLDAELRRAGFRLYRLYSLTAGWDGELNFANAIYRLA